MLNGPALSIISLVIAWQRPAVSFSSEEVQARLILLAKNP